MGAGVTRRMVSFSSKLLRLRTSPEYFVKLAVPEQEWVTRAAKVAGCDEKAEEAERQRVKKKEEGVKEKKKKEDEKQKKEEEEKATKRKEKQTKEDEKATKAAES